MPARLSSEGPLLDYKIPDYRYYPTTQSANGPRDWSRVRFMQACERLNIPYEQWPDFGKLMLPVKTRFSKRPPPFKPPPFDPLRDGAVEWRRKAYDLFRKHCDEFLREISEDLRDWVKSGYLTKLERTKRDPPLPLRFEWAARRYCLHERYKDMATDKYSDILIRQVVHRINVAVQLASVTNRLCT